MDFKKLKNYYDILTEKQQDNINRVIDIITDENCSWLLIFERKEFDETKNNYACSIGGLACVDSLIALFGMKEAVHDYIEGKKATFYIK